MAHHSNNLFFSLSRIPHTLLLCLLPLATLIHGIEVTPDSPCSNFCVDRAGVNISDPIMSSTFTRDLSCLDSDYSGSNSTAVGRKFRSCVGCQQDSAAQAEGSDGPENDQYWFLFNMKSTVGWCVNGFFETQQNPNTTFANEQCGSTCASIGTALGDRLLQTNETLQYNYCESDNGAFMEGVDACKKCLDGKDNLRIHGNFLGALKSACEQQPSPGTLIKLDSDVFSTTSTSPTSPPASSSSNSASSGSGSGSNSTDSSSSISGGAIAGIVIGAIAGIALIGLAAFLLLRRRRSNYHRRDGAHEVSGVGVGLGDVKSYRELRGQEAARELEAQGPGNVPVELPTSDAWGKGNGGQQMDSAKRDGSGERGIGGNGMQRYG